MVQRVVVHMDKLAEGTGSVRPLTVDHLVGATE